MKQARRILVLSLTMMLILVISSIVASAGPVGYPTGEITMSHSRSNITFNFVNVTGVSDFTEVNPNSGGAGSQGSKFFPNPTGSILQISSNNRELNVGGGEGIGINGGGDNKFVEGDEALTFSLADGVAFDMLTAQFVFRVGANRTATINYEAKNNGATVVVSQITVTDTTGNSNATGIIEPGQPFDEIILTEGDRRFGIRGGGTVFTTIPADAGRIDARVWDDQNADGKQNGSENNANLSGINVELVQTNGASFDPPVIATTGNDGIATFFVAPDNYKLKFHRPADYGLTPRNRGNDDQDSDAKGDGTTDTFSVAPNSVVNNQDAGFWAPAIVIARVWDDQNADGKQNGSENGANIGEVPVYVTETDGTRIPGLEGTTDLVTGEIMFVGVPADRPFKLEFGLPEDTRFTLRNRGSEDQDSDAKGDGTTDSFSANRGSHLITFIDAGIWDLATVEARVWDDQNADGKQNGSENGENISGINVYVTETDGTLIPGLMGTTDANGIASIPNVPTNRSFKLKFDLPEDTRFTLRNRGNEDQDSDAKGDGTTDSFTATRGSQTINQIDAGIWDLATVEARVWDDQNADGKQNGSENGANISGINVYVTETDGTPIDGLMGITNENGIASIPNVPTNRSFKLKFDLPEDTRFTLRNRGNEDQDSDAKGDGTTDSFTATRGSQTINQIDAGIWSLATVEARVWDDRNGDGKQNGSENGANLEGVLVKAVETDGVTQIPGTDEVATDENGIAVIDNIPTNRPFKLMFTDPDTDRKFTLRNLGNEDQDSDAKGDGTTDSFSATRGNQTIRQIDAGIWDLGTVEARVWWDVNGDGKQNGSENGQSVAGVTVEVIETNGNSFDPPLLGTTGVNGIAVIEGVPSNRSLKLKFHLPNNANFTARNQGDDTQDSDAKGDGTTDSFSADRGSDVINSVDAGLIFDQGYINLVESCGLTFGGSLLAEFYEQNLGELVDCAPLTYSDSITRATDILVGYLFNGNPGAWEISTSGGIQPVRKHASGVADNQPQMGQVWHNIGLNQDRNWDYYVTGVSDDGKIIYGYAVNPEDITIRSNSQDFFIPAGEQISIFWPNNPTQKRVEVHLPRPAGTAEKGRAKIIGMLPGYMVTPMYVNVDTPVDGQYEIVGLDAEGNEVTFVFP